MNTPEQTFVIVGAGLAGTSAAETLREQGFAGRVVLVGNESEHPYNRPPLSKDYLQGASERDKVFLHPDSWYVDQNIELCLGARVTSLDRGPHRANTQNGHAIVYDKLLLATGSAPRRLEVPGADLDGVLYLRRLGDCEVMRAAFAGAHRVAIVGGGWIGLETAAAARAAGCEVTVLERGELPLLRVLGRELAEIYAAVHRKHGVQLRLGAAVAEITGTDGRANGLRLQDGRLIEADVIVVGVGITPNTELAEASGLSIDNGVLVDEHLATSDPDIFAAGDVANAYHPMLGTHLRLEHWFAAEKQGPVAALNMLGGAACYDQVPYFFSDQYGMGMEYSGYVGAGGYDEVVFRGDVNEGGDKGEDRGRYVAFWLREGRVLAGMNVNVWDQTDTITDLVRSHAQVDRARLIDPRTPLTEVRTDARIGAQS